ncbi:hypothetical protein CYMTET_26453 [Cymbomonas tetramitiformis]|uniref:Aspartokinase n=1 Tax=Cymbomonas tetramitiformis TaxID=36881 RepID=A0AAE0KY82_9CHLO|nr:hypothetical protein CYMTET_26453 [Cymbomonas tetramitiformis]
MGKTTNNLLLAGEQAVNSVTDSDTLDGLTRSLIEHTSVQIGEDVEDSEECSLGCEYLCTFQNIVKLHHDTCDELGIPRATVQELLNDLERLLLGIALMKEISPRTKDLLVSFGERMSTRIFAKYVNDTLKEPAKQYDAWDIGFVSSDEFTNARIDYDKSLANVKEKLTFGADDTPHMPIITGFLAKGEATGAITTLGRGGSDLSATIVGCALGLKEVQVWKDVDGIMSTDPRRAPNAVTVPFLTFEEATELAFFGATVLHPQAMAPARRIDMPVRVKNSYNPPGAGTLITGSRDMSDVLLTSIVLKSNVTLVDVMSERKTGFIGFASSVFLTLRELSISTDVVATSETSITASLDPAQLWSRELSSEELKEMVETLEEKCQSKVTLLTNKAIVSLIGNVNRTAEILMTVFTVFHAEGIQVQMISQGASKVNISLVVDNDEADDIIMRLHREFFE